MGWQSLAAQNLEFPKDEGKHENADFEAWSLLTHLNTDNKINFGVAVFFFTGKVVGINASGLYVVVSEQKKNEYEKYKKIQFPLINSTTHTEGHLLENYSGNIFSRSSQGGPFTIKIDKDDFVLSLKFVPTKNPIDMGNIAVGDNSFNRIYVIPSGNIVAEMTYKNKNYDLKGIGVFQHQWGDKPEENLLSDMFALHFNDGHDILIYHSDTSSGINKMLISDANDSSIIANKFFAKADSIASVKSTGDRFALDWNINSTEHRIIINIRPTNLHQEIEMLDMTYWLARCKVSANINGKAVNGIGYVYIKRRNVD